VKKVGVFIEDKVGRKN